MKRLFLTSLIVIFWSTLVVVEAHKKVWLRDIQTITLWKGFYTNGRRSSSVPQLRCVGGRARNEQHVETVQCYNRGFDGMDVQWECTADLPAHLRLGKISVSCEGYDHRNDPYILEGSCGLKYELEYANNYSGYLSFVKRWLVDKLVHLADKPVHLAMILGFVFIVVLIVRKVRKNARPDRRTRTRTHSASSAPPPYDDCRDDDPGPPPYDEDDDDDSDDSDDDNDDSHRRDDDPGPPPPYDDSDDDDDDDHRRGDNSESQGKPSSSSHDRNMGGDTRSRGTDRRNRNQQNGPDFWSGVGLGALGGHMYSSAQSGRHQTGSTWGNQGGTTLNLYQSSAGTSMSSFTTHTSTSYGGTMRR